MDACGRRAAGAFALCALCAVAALALCGLYAWQGFRAHGVQADPYGAAARVATAAEGADVLDGAGAASGTAAAAGGVGAANAAGAAATGSGSAESAAADGAWADDARFPAVDWDYWRNVNPAVVGWVTVPGTRIDGPVVAASAADPQYYLTHDVYGDANVFGCAYLDSACAANGFGGLNSVVLGHHMADGSMFADFARYTGEGFLAEHPTVLLQGPGWKRPLAVLGACAVPGSEACKRTSFATEQDFQGYVAGLLARSAVRGGPDELPAQIYTFVTCSYAHENDRTLVVAALEQPEGQPQETAGAVGNAG